VNKWIVEPLSKLHRRDKFTCGKPSLDEFIRLHVSQYEKRRLGKTFVVAEPDETNIVAYYTLAASAITFEHVPVEISKKLPKHPVPVILLARLAIDQSVQGQRLGEYLLLDALFRCHELSGKLGVHAVEVEALDESARQFYEKYGFTPLLDNPLHLFLPVKSIPIP
jgi:GNAT superfamily N-acetyltransferase